MQRLQNAAHLCHPQSRTHARLSGTHSAAFVSTNRCDECGASFAQPGTLVNHKRTHTGAASTDAPITPPQSLSQEDTLAAGNATHYGGVFTPLRQLRVPPPGERPYKCDCCDEAFTQLGSLVRHKRTHTGAPHRAHISPERERHPLSVCHALGERPFKCEECGLAFVESNKLTMHRRRAHGDKTILRHFHLSSPQHARYPD